MTELSKALAKAVLVCCFVLGAAQAASAQTMWRLGDMAFPARDGWCSKITDQGTPEKPSQTLEARPCGHDFPYMSLGVGRAADGHGAADVAPFSDSGIAFASGPDSKALVAGIIGETHSKCVEIAYNVRRDPFPGLKGFSVESSYNCEDTPGTPQKLYNFTAFASTKTGEIWIVAFDYPLADVTGGDIAMLQSAIATISAR